PVLSFFCLGSQDTRVATQFTAPSRTFWIILSIALFFAPRVGAALPLCAQAGLQLVQLTLQGQHDPLRNQTALVDQSRSTVTYYITSQSNHTAVGAQSVSQGYVCYKPVEQRACYLRRMDAWDLQTLQTSSNLSEQRADWLLHQNNQTKYYREFLGVLAGEQVDPNSLGEAVQTLCEQTSIFWVRRGQGNLQRWLGKAEPPSPGSAACPCSTAATQSRKQRLIYLCIDICFPSNICVSICFYYLPE
uniref:BRICHOS domain containing 5 n=1 Tax=Falco tinnunculus TaxID=100819 RepID=A0A8C4UPG3_FALTI